jgi:hypothetical protein
MTPAEYTELIIMLRDSTGLHATNAVGLFTAYIVAMYLAATKLSRFQLVLVTSLYSLFYLAPARTAIESLSHAYLLASRLVIEYPDQQYIVGTSDLLTQPVASLPLIAGFAIAWIGSIVFVWDIRRKKIREV